MFSHNNQISIRQLQALLILNILGTGLITLPSKCAAMVGNDGWILVFFGGIIALLLCLLIDKAVKSYPANDLSELCKKLLSVPVAVIICLAFSIKIIITTGLQLRIFSEVVRQTMLATTPYAVSSLALVLVATMCGYYGFECRGRVAEILFIVLAITLVFVFITSAVNTDFSELKPILSGGVGSAKTIFNSSIYTAFAFSGIELLLISLFFLRKKDNSKKALSSAMIILVIAMTFISAVTIARFGVYDVIVKRWAVLQLMDTVSAMGSFIERQDIFILRFWIIAAFSAISAGIYLSSLLFTETVKSHESRRSFLLGTAAMVFVIGQIPKNVDTAYELLDKINLYGTSFFAFALPIILIIAAGFKKRREGR